MPHLLFRLAEENGIAIEQTEFFYSDIEAMYISCYESHPVICLSKTLYDNRYHLRSVLAHELGHHFTSGKSTVKSHTYYRDKVESCREESRAWRWAANYLIPSDTLKEIYSEDFCEIWQLADFFEVDEGLIRIKLAQLEEELKIISMINETDEQFWYRHYSTSY